MLSLALIGLVLLIVGVPLTWVVVAVLLMGAAMTAFEKAGGFDE